MFPDVNIHLSTSGTPGEAAPAPGVNGMASGFRGAPWGCGEAWGASLAIGPARKGKGEMVTKIHKVGDTESDYTKEELEEIGRNVRSSFRTKRDNKDKKENNPPDTSGTNPDRQPGKLSTGQ